MDARATQVTQLPYLSVEQVTLRVGRGDSVLLSQLCLTLHPGERCVVVGHSGSGKTLLFRLLNGLLPPSQGRIDWQGKSIAEIPGPELRRQVAWVSRSPRLLGMNTVKDAIAYPLKLQSLSDHEIQQRLDQAFQALTLPLDWLSQSASALSLLEQWWVTLARAWVMQPGLLLLERPEFSNSSEPPVSSGGGDDGAGAAWRDVWGEAALDRAIATFQAQGGSVIVACRHDAPLLCRSAHQTFVLSQGQLHPVTGADPSTAIATLLSKEQPSHAEWDDEDWGDDLDEARPNLQPSDLH